jgi:hypothetical protein
MLHTKDKESEGSIKALANEIFDQTMSISFEAHKWSTQ